MEATEETWIDTDDLMGGNISELGVTSPSVHCR